MDYSEMNSIETYAPALVDTLGSCLNHEMTSADLSGVVVDTPHCKIACELLNSLFLVSFFFHLFPFVVSQLF